MLNDDSIENGKKRKTKQNKTKQSNNNNNNDMSNQQKKTKNNNNNNNFARAAHFFVHFFAFVVGRLQLETFQLHFLRRKCRMFSRKNYCLSSYSFSFSLRLIFTLLAANISHFLTTAIKFLCCVSNEICLLCFSSLALVFVTHVSLLVKIQSKRDLALLLLFFFYLQPSGWMTQDDLNIDVYHYKTLKRAETDYWHGRKS